MPQLNWIFLQGRFKAILIDADEYLKHLSRYIHLNPVRAKMVSNPAEYNMEQLPCLYWGTKEASAAANRLAAGQFWEE